MKKETRILVILLIIAFLIGVIGVVKLKQVESTNQAKQTMQQAPPASSSRPAPVRIAQFRGIVESVNAKNLHLVLKDGKNETLTLYPGVDMQRIISGTLEKGDVNTEKANLNDLTMGQEVLVVINKDKGDVRTILIIK